MRLSRRDVWCSDEREPRARRKGLPLCSGRVVPVPSEHSGTANWHLSQYRTLLPFFLIIAVVLLLIWRLVPLPIRIAPVPSPSTTLSYIVQPGDTCWDIANDHNSSLDKLLVVNPKVNCEKLMPGGRVCVPDEGMSISVLSTGLHQPMTIFFYSIIISGPFSKHVDGKLVQLAQKGDISRAQFLLQSAAKQPQRRTARLQTWGHTVNHTS
ncbi:hypothetical protein BD769DRAFT_1678561 [Suillus cothurnatus]|nr:hypothetical protein BD769DRAFT_1678561 [Suillus cothurnatus]